MSRLLSLATSRSTVAPRGTRSSGSRRLRHGPLARITSISGAGRPTCTNLPFSGLPNSTVSDWPLLTTPSRSGVAMAPAAEITMSGLPADRFLGSRYMPVVRRAAPVASADRGPGWSTDRGRTAVGGAAVDADRSGAAGGAGVDTVRDEAGGQVAGGVHRARRWISPLACSSSATPFGSKPTDSPPTPHR